VDLATTAGRATSFKITDNPYGDWLHVDVEPVGKNRVELKLTPTSRPHFPRADGFISLVAITDGHSDLVRFPIAVRSVLSE
jgi:hypothetical protein